MLALVPLCSAFAPGLSVAPRAPRTAVHRAPVPEASLGIDLKGKVAFVAGVADSAGYGWAIVKALSEAGATVAVGTWPPVLAIFEKSLKSGKLDDDLILSDGSKMAVPKIYPLDAVFDEPGDVPDDVKKAVEQQIGEQVAAMRQILESQYAERVSRHEAKIRDVSRGGVCFFLDRPVEEMTALRVEFDLPTEHGLRRITGDGAVVRCEKISRTLEHYEIAVFVQNMAAPDRDTIEQYVASIRD